MATGEVLRLGVVGCGLISQLAHLPALSALDDRFALVAVSDPSERVRTTVAGRCGVGEAYARHEDMLERSRLDAVLVASPNGTHARVIHDALEAGAHVLVEKPMCLTTDDAASVVELAASRRRVVQVGYMKRFDRAYEALRQRLPAPGEVRLIASTTVDPGIGERYRPPGFVASTDVGRSEREALRRSTEEQVARAIGSDDPSHVRPFSDAFLGALVHDVNLVLGLLGGLGLEPTSVTDAISRPDGSLAYGACAISRPDGSPAYGACAISRPDGSPAYGACAIGPPARWTAAWMLLPDAGAFREELRLFAGDGVRALSFPAPYGSSPACLDLDGDARWFGPAADSYVAQLVHFHDCVTTGMPCRTPASQGARDIALLTELYRTAIAA